MDVTIEDDGRKLIRTRLESDPGPALSLESADTSESDESLPLRPAKPGAPLRCDGSLLVHTGRRSGEELDIIEFLREQRAKRAERHAGISE